MSKFFSTPKRTVVSTACIAVIILAIASFINTALTKDHHADEGDTKVASLSKEDKSSYIGDDHAKAIALEHANLTEKDVRFLHTEFDRENGIMVYEVSFYLGRTEYEYTIDAVTGEIVGYDIDRD